MLLGHRWLLLGVLSLPILSACGSSSHGSESGTIAPSGVGVTVPVVPVAPPKAAPAGGTGTAGDDNSVSAIASVASLSVALGATQTITVVFTSSDGAPITAFSVYGSLGTLPAGWSAPSALTCALVRPGSGCVLTLTYTPTVIETGTLSLECVYVDNAGLPRTPGPCLSLAYASTASNNVVASIAPSGEIDAAIGRGGQSVTVTFTTDDGNAATTLNVTNLSALPAGWSSTSAGLSCAVVGTGSGCQLPLVFAPTATGTGTLTLNYDYLDGSGASRTGALNIPFASASNGTVVASVSPTGEVNATITGGSQSVAVTFDTADGRLATGFSVLTDLTKLPPGWSTAAKTFTCAAVSTGNGCLLQLQYAPTALNAGTLTLRYQYTDSSGTPNFGVVNVPYAATTNDNVAGTPAPAGQITAMLGSPGQTVTVAFSTDDSRLATALQVTSGLSALPPGWSASAGTFACVAVSSPTSCVLTLTYAPTGVDNGTLNLGYAYVNNAGQSKSGSVGIPYRTTTNDNIVGTPNPSSVTAVTGSSNPVTVTFTTDDGNFASGLSADLSALPLGWTAPASSFTCASVSVGSACQVTLTYAPTAAAAGTLVFGFSYVNSAGTAKTGTVSIPYTAAP